MKKLSLLISICSILMMFSCAKPPQRVGFKVDAVMTSKVVTTMSGRVIIEWQAPRTERIDSLRDYWWGTDNKRIVSLDTIWRDDFPYDSIVVIDRWPNEVAMHKIAVVAGEAY